jgi:hypothetical protein
MGRRKVTDEKSAKPIRGPGRKSRKQGEPTFPKELMLPDSAEKKTFSSRSKKRFVFWNFSFFIFYFVFF